jgi:hypothetical protein
MIVPFVYKAGFDNTQYFTSQAFALPFIACGIALALSFLSARHGAVAMFIASFGSLLSFANASYLYLSSVFFSGIAGTLGGMLEQIGFHWAFCAIAFVVAMVVSIVTMFLPESSF